MTSSLKKKKAILSLFYNHKSSTRRAKRVNRRLPFSLTYRFHLLLWLQRKNRAKLRCQKMSQWRKKSRKSSCNKRKKAVPVT